MKQFIAPTEDFIKLEKSELAADVAAGSNVSITLLNNNGLAQYDYVVIGKEGSEKAEIQQINAAVSGGTIIQVATLKYAHKAGEPIVKYRYNKRKFYGALTATGSYTELTSDGSPRDIEVDDPQGTRFEYTGVDNYAYFKSTYYNSQEDIETDIDDSTAVPGDQSKRYASLYGIRKMAGFTDNPFVTDERIENKRLQAENEINSKIMQRYSLPLSEIPPILTYICECLAAGYMHYEEYGPEGDAVKKLGEARGMLKNISDGTQKLIGSDYQELTITRSTTRLEGKPDGTETGCTEQRKFTVGQKF